jgi:hypothetical protein
MGLFSIKSFPSNVYQLSFPLEAECFVHCLFSTWCSLLFCPHHRRLFFYFWTFVCSNCDIFHLLGTDKCWCKTILAQKTRSHLNRLLYHLNKLRTRLATVKSACFAKLAPCEATFKQHVLRASLQTYVWYRAILESPLLRVLCSLARTNVGARQSLLKTHAATWTDCFTFTSANKIL